MENRQNHEPIEFMAKIVVVTRPFPRSFFEVAIEKQKSKTTEAFAQYWDSIELKIK